MSLKEGKNEWMVKSMDKNEQNLDNNLLYIELLDFEETNSNERYFWPSKPTSTKVVALRSSIEKLWDFLKNKI